MLDTARPIVQTLLEQSPALRKDDFVKDLMELHGIPEETTNAVLKELTEKGAIVDDGHSISLVESEHRIFDWSFYLFSLHFRLSIGTKDSRGS